MCPACWLSFLALPVLAVLGFFGIGLMARGRGGCCGGQGGCGCKPEAPVQAAVPVEKPKPKVQPKAKAKKK